MTLRIGSDRGFTLIEVMVAAIVLVAVIVFIYESFLLSLDVFSYCADYYRVSSWMGEKVWQVQDDIRRFGFLARIEKGGSFVKNKRSFYWELACNLAQEAPELDLYNIDLKLNWQIGAKKFTLRRGACAIYKYEKEEN